jgi:predicted nucleic acid-binding protein
VGALALPQHGSVYVDAKLKTPDAIHAATALLAGCALFVTNDPAFKRIAGLPVGLLSEARP